MNNLLSRNWHRLSRLILALAALGLMTAGLTRSLSAEEPYERFLQRLREERLFDLALVYLEQLDAQPGVSQEFKSDIDLERGMLQYQSAAVLPARSPVREERLNAAEASLRKFLDEKKGHPRRGEGRLKLGELLLTRAEEAKGAETGDAQADAAAAVKFYSEAHQLFENTIVELSEILKQLEGNRIDPADTVRVAYRQKVRQDLRQAQLLSAKAIEERGLSRPVDSPERPQDLQQALQMFSDLYSKEQRMIGIRNYALFYRSEIHAELGKVDDAIDGFQRIADLEGVDVLRGLQTNALTELIQLLAAEKKHPLAVERATRWLAGLRPDERSTTETLNLQLALAKVRIAWAEQLKAADANDRVASRLVRDTRDDLRGLLRKPGPHMDEARELLAQLGVETAVSPQDELPTVKDFAEALAEAQKRIDQSETDAIGQAVLEETLADPNADAESREQATAQLAELQATIARTREQALALLREGLRLYDADDDRTQLFEARFRMAFLLLKLDRPTDAMVVGEFLARTNPATEQGLRAAAVTLTSFSGLLNAAGEDKSAVIDQLEPFAEYLLSTWPQSPEAAAAAAALTQLSMIDKDWDKAEKFLGLVPESNAAVAQQQRDLGLSFYIEYLQAKQAEGPTAEATDAFRTRAIRWLELGVKGVQRDNFDSSVVDSLNALARLLLSTGRVDEAARWLMNGDQAVLPVLEAQPQLASAKASMESYRTAIQVVAAQLVAGTLEDAAAVDKMQLYIAQLQKLAAATPQGEETLIGIFLALARDLKDKLSETNDKSQRTRLSEAVLLVVREAGKSNSFNTQYWAGSTMISIAEELASDGSSREASQKAFAEGAAMLQAVLEREKDEPGWIQPEAAKIQIQVALARAQSGMGNYQAAVLSLGEILDENNALLDVQILAAETLQAWGSQKPDFYRFAIIGGRKSAKTRQNVIWGWGKIAQMTTNQPNFTEQFYNARYQLAKSRLRYALSLNDPQQKLAEVKRSEKDILSTASLYPQLGGDKLRQDYDALLKLIQKELGKPADGLKVLDNK